MKLQDVLMKLAKFEEHHYKLILVVFLFLTLIVSSGMYYLKVQSDLNKSFPQDLDYFVTSDKVTEKFGGQDTILVLVELDGNYSSSDAVLDIRDPEVTGFISTLSKKMSEESDIDSVTSIYTLFNIIDNSALSEYYTTPLTASELNQFLSQEQFSSFNSLFNNDYTKTLIILNADLGSGQDKLKEIENLVREKASNSGIPPGVKIEITGTPSMMNLVLKLLISDAVKTLIIGAVIIFFMLVFMQKSFTKSMLVFLPLLFGIAWTLGTMGWMNLPISLATAGIGAMILGLGVEYGVFLLSRYQEERKKDSSKLESMEVALSNIGSSIIGSGLTTIVGFIALMASTMPLLRDLGLSLALGIFYCLIITLLVTPSFILLEEKIAEEIKRK